MPPLRLVDVAADLETRNAASPAHPPSSHRSIRILHVSKSVAEFSYHESLIRHLCARGHSVHALFDQGYGDQSASTAVRAFARATDRFSAGAAVCPQPWRRRALVGLQELATLSSYRRRTNQSPFYLERFEAGMPAWLRSIGRLPGVRRILAGESASRRLLALARRLPAERVIGETLRQLRPDVVIASPANMRRSFEAEYLRAAKRRGIPTVIPVFSWDNLTTKSLFPTLPDLLLAWNETQVRDAIEIHSLPRDAIVVTGAPLFDRWNDARLGGRSRSEFSAHVGLDAQRPFICYLGSTAAIAQDETWLIQSLAGAIRDHPDERVRELAILVRPHPLHTATYAALNEPGVVVWPRVGHLPDSEEALTDFYDTLRFSRAAIGINTTAMLDAVIVDTPCIAVVAERYSRTQDQAAHFRNLRDSDAIEEVRGAEECLDVVRCIGRGEDRKAGQRRRFVEQFIRPGGVETEAGSVAARCIEEMVRTWPAADGQPNALPPFAARRPEPDHA